MTNIKPGFLVSCRVSKIFENGAELSFLGGMTGTCFADHMPEGLSIGSKVTARVISADGVSKIINLSMKKHIIDLEPCQVQVKVSDTFNNVKVKKSLYGGSYLVTLPNLGQGFLHKI